MKKCVKSIVVIMLLFIVAIAFCACAEINVSLISNSDGSIDQVVDITIDTVEIMNAGMNPTEVRQDIKNYGTATVEWFKDRLVEKCNHDLSTETDPEMVTKLMSYKVDGITMVGGEKWDGKTFTVGIRFKDIGVYRYFFEIPEDSSTDWEFEHHFFYDKQYCYSRNLYSVYNGASFYESLKTHFESYPETLVNSTSNKMLYTYVATSKREHSDADYVSYINGEYHHTWIISDENIDEPIMFYYNVANPENWLLTAIVASGATCLILFIVNLIITSNKKIKEKK